jgi:asparagine synthase (glutamine-hydrolysing)
VCGIAGIINLNREPISQAILHRMTEAIKHRGPDDNGLFIDDYIGFGHRRLSILDLSSAGSQPMSTRDGRYTITYNGEVFNFRELKNELENNGYEFYSQTDTEVVVQAYAHWGIKSLDRFNGMYALAIWDNKTNELVIARDRYGIKPLYYVHSENCFVFASEIKSILQHPSYSAKLDQEGLIEYFTFQNFFTSKTLFKDALILPAGSYITVKPNHDKYKVSDTIRYWDFCFSEPLSSKVDEREYLEELDRLFVQAVNRQLVSDVDLGAYLSGGIDSGSITAIASKHQPYLKTFTCGFDLHSASGLEMKWDERESAEWMSYLFKTEHYEMVLKAGDMERALLKMTWHLEEPRTGQSYPNFYIAQLASKFVKVILSGTGGDELFAGYPWRYYRAIINENFEHYVDNYYEFWQRLIPSELFKEVFSPIWHNVAHVNTRDIFRNVFQQPIQKINRPEDYINHSLYFEAKTFLHGLLVVEDKLSMAHGLETRVPFLDNDLVDFVTKVPVRLKLANLDKAMRLDENEPGNKFVKYYHQMQDGKILLRKAMERYIPLEVVNRGKQGFSAPDASWFKGDSIEYVRRLLLNNQARIYEFLDRDTVYKLVNEHLEGKHNRRLLIWSLLSFEHWCSQFL